MNQKDKVNVMNKTTYRYHINALSDAIPDIAGNTLPSGVA